MNLLRIGLSLVCLTFTGCSYAFVRPAPIDHEERTWVDCTSSRVAPIADLVGVAGFAGSALVLEAVSQFGQIDETFVATNHMEPELRAAQVAFIGAAVLEVASAAYGFRHTSQCDQVKEQWQMRINKLPAPAACIDDADCKSDRRCVGGTCTWPTHY